MDSICDVWLRSGYNFDALDMLDKINGIVSLDDMKSVESWT